MKLSPQQQTAFDTIMKWHAGDEKTFTLAGYAGTGKTTLAKEIAAAIDPELTIFCAYTGKAAYVLKEKGCETAGTLHHHLYALADHDKSILKKLEKEIVDAREKGDAAQVKAFINLLEQKRAEFRKPRFGLNTDSAINHAPLVIVDEYSMLPKELIDDLEKMGKKILYLGDPFQLPPVKGECPLTPDLFITEIHRQALESPIIRAATDVREGRNLKYCIEDGFKYQPKRAIDPEEYKNADQIIVGRNNTRSLWNGRFRTLNGVDPLALPQIGEKMICLKNEPFLELFNGLIGNVTYDALDGIGKEYYMLDFEDHKSLPVYYGDIQGKSHLYDGYSEAHKKLQRFDFAYAITCHKAQGSEFDNCLIYNEPIGKDEMRRRWLYTAITRGKNSVTLVEP